jgi:uncharacterized repeat protein (TIGR01451 family)
MIVFIWISILVSTTVYAGSFTDFNLVDQTPDKPLVNPLSDSYHARYVSGFGLDNAFTIFFEDRKDGNRIKFVTTTTGPEGFPSGATATDIQDTHFLVKPWPITVNGTVYAYRAWAAVGNNKDLTFYVSNNLVNWTLVSTFQISNSAALGDGYGYVYYGFHDVIRLNATFYAFAETNTGHTVIVRSADGNDSWEAFVHMGGINGSGPLGTPSGASGWTGRGNFFDLGNDRGLGKIYIDPRDSAFYLAVNSAARASLSPSQLEAAFINPANWTWNDNTTGSAANPIATETSEHDLRECWLVPRSTPTREWTIVYDADFGSGDGGKALGYFGLVADLILEKTLDSTPPFKSGSQVEYSVTITNNGPSHATNIIMLDTLTNQTLDSIQVITCPQGSSCLCGSAGSCVVDKLENGQRAAFRVTATIDGVGDFSNSVSATAEQMDPDPVNSSAKAGAKAEDPGPSVPTLNDAATLLLLCLLAFFAMRRMKEVD